MFYKSVSIAIFSISILKLSINYILGAYRQRSAEKSCLRLIDIDCRSQMLSC